MAKAKIKKANKNQTYIILVIALILAGAGYYGYRSMLASPDINKITTGEIGGKPTRSAVPVKTPTYAPVKNKPQTTTAPTNPKKNPTPTPVKYMRAPISY